MEKPGSKKYRETHRDKLNTAKLEWYYTNKERISRDRKENGYYKDYYSKNKDTIKVKGKEYCDENREKINAKRREYVAINKDKVVAKKHEYAVKNSSKISEKNKEYAKNNKDKIIANGKKYYAENREIIIVKVTEREKLKYANDPQFKLKKLLRQRLRSVLKNQGVVKSIHTLNLISCTVPELKVHLEKQFTPEMNWGNHGTYWHIDHIKPCVAFNLLDIEEQKKCFHFTNLRPLESKENIKKGSKILTLSL